MMKLSLVNGIAARSALAIFALATSAAGLHCSSTRPVFEAEPPPETPPGPLADASTNEAEAPLPDCADENKLIYVVSEGENALHRFDPEALTFTRIGRVRCPTSSDTFSMAVDRRGTAWVEYANGRIYKVSTKDGTCEPTAFQPLQYELRRFGMGFAKDDSKPGAPLTETLYLVGSMLAKLDLQTLEVSVVGPSSSELSELTGTGAGTLYAFASADGRIVRLDKTNGDVKETFRPDVSIGGGRFGFAFAQWGGDFWLFTGTTGRSWVTRYSPTKNTSTVVVEDTGMMIVGAGSSTCAPSEPR